MKNDWDVITLYSGYKHGLIPDYNGISKIVDGYSTTTVAYLLNKRAYDILLNNFIYSKIALENEMKNNYEPNQKVYQTQYAIDQSWIKLQNTLKFFVFDPNIVKNYNSNSEINTIIEKFLNFFNLKNNNINENFINYTNKPVLM